MFEMCPQCKQPAAMCKCVENAIIKSLGAENKRLRERVKELESEEEQRKAEDAKLFRAARIKIQGLQKRLRNIEKAAREHLNYRIEWCTVFSDAEQKLVGTLTDALGEEKQHDR